MVRLTRLCAGFYQYTDSCGEIWDITDGRQDGKYGIYNGSPSRPWLLSKKSWNYHVIFQRLSKVREWLAEKENR